MYAIVAAIIGGFCIILAAVLGPIVEHTLRKKRSRQGRGVKDGGSPSTWKLKGKGRVIIIIIRLTLAIAGIANLGISLSSWLLPPVAALDVSRFYFPSGKVGDIGDVSFGTGRFIYEPLGREPHEYEWKYNEDGSLNPNPAEFAGVCWLNPAGNFGTMSGGGKDLSDYNKIHWEGRSLGDPVNVEFFIGGVTWIWGKDSDGKPKIVEPPYPGVPKYGLGTYKLTSDWQEFDVPLHIGKADLKRVICGFGWVASWGNNDVQLNEDGTGPVEKKKFEFEIREIRYEKGD